MKASTSFFKMTSGVLLMASLLGFSSCEQEKEVSPRSFCGTGKPRESSTAGNYIPNRYIVVFKEAESTLAMRAGASYQEQVAAVRDKAQKLVKQYGIEQGRVEQVYASALKGFAANLSPQEFAALSKDVSVAFLEQDQIVSVKIEKGKPSNSAGSELIPYGVAKVGYGDGSGKTAWIVDSGIDLDHPDLNVNTALSRTFVTTGKDADSPDDNYGHGTHVAGTIGAKLNNIGVVSVAYNATVVAVKVLDSKGTGPVSQVVAGLDYIAANASRGHVVNLSLIAPASTILDNAVLNVASKGILVSVAAGNNAANANSFSPGRVNHNNVYTVSAIDANNAFAWFSNFGNPPVDFAAPGVDVMSAYLDGKYESLNGTSMAAPHVAGILLLGRVNIGGYATGDPDGTPDPIARR